MNAAEAREYLDRLQVFGVKLGLENIRTLLSALGGPERRFPSVLVAGTNGKGSVASMLASILEAQGFRTGLYTSPHLVRVEERIRIDGRMIPARAFCSRLGKIRTAIDGLMAGKKLVYHPTFFEVLTALAFLYFADEGIDIGVIEVGMGGRFDATNVLEPLVSVITTISLEHQQYLGDTLGKIAFEKAGIIRPGRPVVCGVGEKEALDVIKSRAEELGSPLVRVLGPGKRLEAEMTDRRFRFSYTADGETISFTPGLAGRHQGGNAATAVAAARALDRTWKKIGRRAVLKGLAAVRWEGRLETVSRRPLVILDGAHNREGAGSLARYIKDVIGGPVVLVYASMKDKDIPAVTRLLFPAAARVVLTRVPMDRSADPESIAEAAGPAARPFILEPDTRKAVRAALAEAGGRLPVVIAGSLYLVGEVKRLRVFAN